MGKHSWTDEATVRRQAAALEVVGLPGDGYTGLMGTPDRSPAEQVRDAASSLAQSAKDTVKRVAETVQDAVGRIKIPGAPGGEPPTVEEPTEPREPLPPKPDQKAPRPVSPTGKDDRSALDARAQASAYLTTAQGLRLHDTDHSLKAGPRGPVLLQDHHLREKIMHFDHGRIPERVAHAAARERMACSARTAAPPTSPRRRF
jgi:catalase